MYAESIRLYQLCMICVRQMRPREHHCHICNTCIQQYDHHCTWINGCIGKHNIGRFTIFLVSLQLTLLWVGYIAVRLIVCLSADQT